jgi:hypothetical protein
MNFITFIVCIALESEQEEAFNYGMHFFCPKPVSLELLSIVLAAKREFENNDEAVDRICNVINAAVEEKPGPEKVNPGNGETTNIGIGNPQQSSLQTTSLAAIGIGTTLSNNNNTNLQNTSNTINNHTLTISQELKDDKNKWILFRRNKGKVFPDQPM